MSSRALLNSFMLCPRLRAKSGNFFAPKRTRTMRRIINRSGPPRLPIPNASIFITILNWLSLMFYSSRSAYIYLTCTDRFSTIWSAYPEADRIRTAFGKVSLLAAGCIPDKEASLAVDAITKFDLLRFMGRDAGAPFWWVASRLLHFQICKSSQVLRIHVGDSPERESLTVPMQDIIAVFSKVFHGCVPPRCRRPDKQINNM